MNLRLRVSICTGGSYHTAVLRESRDGVIIRNFEEDDTGP